MVKIWLELTKNSEVSLNEASGSLGKEETSLILFRLVFLNSIRPGAPLFFLTNFL